MTPEMLLQQIILGDKEAFKRLYDILQLKIYNTCLSYLQNEEDAAETTQDVFVEIFFSAKTFRGNSSATTWAYRIAINKCLDKIRFAKRQKRTAFIASLFKETGELMHDIPVFHHPGVALEQKEKASILFEAIKTLPENQQTAFVLKHTQGLSQKEIVEIMNISEKAIESLLQRAKTGLRKSLSKYYDSEGNDK